MEEKKILKKVDNLRNRRGFKIKLISFEKILYI